MNNSKTSWFTVLQRVGQSLMVPVSVLPAAGLLVALGRVIQQNTEHSQSVVLKTIGEIAFNGGLAIFQQLPVVFAVGVAIGFTGGAGVAALAAVAGYFTLSNVLTVMTTTLALTLKIDTGVFGGILTGLLSAYIYNNYHKTELHPVFGFFSGKRLVPILTTACAILLGLVLAVIWPPIQGQIEHFGMWVMNSSMGPAFYAAGKRALIPLGLHHVYYPSFLYQFGEFTTAAGQVVRGETARYFAGDPTAGRIMASEFPIMLFGLPAAAFAMYLRAIPSKRKAVAGVMMAAALTSIITGITEPIEFAFIFVAPILYIFHVLAAFMSGLLTAQLDVHLGYTFSASLIDWFLGYFNQKNSLWLFAVIGPCVAALYFTVFYVLIGKMDLKTPGRDLDDAGSDTDETSTSSVAATSTESEKATKVLAALGGSQNLTSIDACITRLRLEVKNRDLVNESSLKKLGASGTLKIGQSGVQVVFGVQSDKLKEQIKNIIKNEKTPISSGSAIVSPLKGEIVSLSQVPDQTFSQKMLGDGFAVNPTEGFVVAPCDAEVINLFPTLHAIGLLTSEGAEILIHVGIDTVKMKGDGFKSLVKTGDTVKKGQKLLEFSIDKIKSAGYNTITPVIVTNGDQFQITVSKNNTSVTTTDVVANIQKKG